MTEELIQENRKDIGTRIKAIRKTLRLNQKEMAEKLNTLNTYISEIETGKGNPGHTFFFKFAYTFSVSLNFLFFGQGDMFLETDPKIEPGENKPPEKITSTADLVWYLENSPMFYHNIIGLATKFKYENEEIIKRDIEENQPSEDE
jgi:transcriptional regulator with XRE-family HTH domain